MLPVTAYDKDGVRMLLNFASDCPPGRPDVLVMVVSMLNTAPLSVHNVVLQAAVPKVEELIALFIHMFHMFLCLLCCQCVSFTYCLLWLEVFNVAVPQLLQDLYVFSSKHLEGMLDQLDLIHTIEETFSHHFPYSP